MGRIWSEENKYHMWLEVEATASEVLSEAGIVPRSAAQAIRAYGEVDVARIQEIEAEVKHDVIAFTTAMAEKIGPESRWLHYGLTSNSKPPQPSSGKAFWPSPQSCAGEPWSSNTPPLSAAPMAFTPSPRPLASNSSTGTPRSCATWFVLRPPRKTCA
jgi:hypothetical protein